jgi:LAO/AO transport system kinase
VLTCSALTFDGLDTLWQTVLDHRKKNEAAGEMAKKRQRQAIDWMWNLVEDGLKNRFYHHPRVKTKLPKIMAAVQNGTASPTAAAQQLLELLDG